MTRAVCAIVAALSLTACTGGSARYDETGISRSGTPLPDGLMLAPGTTMIGPVIPHQDGGWTAWGELVSDSPLDVYRDYAAQVRRLGGSPTAPVQSCRSDAGSDRCEGGGDLPEGRIAITLARLKHSTPSAAILMFTPKASRPPVAWADDRLDADAPAPTQRADVNRPGENPYRGPSIPAAAGTALVTPPIVDVRGLSGFFFVVRAADPRKTAAAYADAFAERRPVRVEEWGSGRSSVLHLRAGGVAGGAGLEAWATGERPGFVTVLVADRT
jgi:hypothetical protein